MCLSRQYIIMVSTYSNVKQDKVNVMTKILYSLTYKGTEWRQNQMGQNWLACVPFNLIPIPVLVIKPFVDWYEHWFGMNFWLV